jgi:hypothetical protein
LKTEILLSWQLMNSLYDSDLEEALKKTHELALYFPDSPNIGQLSTHKTFMPLLAKSL